MTDPTIESFFKWASGLLFTASGLMVAVTQDFGIKQSPIATGWQACAVGILMTLAGLAILKSCVRGEDDRSW
jgi:hypothetical protein